MKIGRESVSLKNFILPLFTNTFQTLMDDNAVFMNALLSYYLFRACFFFYRNLSATLFEEKC